MKLNYYLIFVLIFIMPFFSYSQYNSIAEVQGMPAGIYTFNFGDGDFQAYIDADGWMLWAQYIHQGGTNPYRRVVQAGNDLPFYDNSPLGTDLSGDITKWGHGAQAFAATIPDSDLWLRFQGQSSRSSSVIHFETPIIGKFQSNTAEFLQRDFSTTNILRADHTSALPRASTVAYIQNGDKSVVENVFGNGTGRFHIRGAGFVWTTDIGKNESGTDIYYEDHTIHRVWVKSNPTNSSMLIGALNDLHNHVNSVQILSAEELLDIKSIFHLYGDRLTNTEAIAQKALSIITDYDNNVGPLFTTDNTNPNSFFQDPERSPGLEYERTILVLEQAIFDYIFTPEGYALYPDLIDGYKFGSCIAFPGDVQPPVDSNVSYTVPIRANFADPYGTNPSFAINGDGTEHAYRPTGFYLAPGSVATVTVPESLVGKDYYIRVGAHEWNLAGRVRYTRLDRVTKKFAINSTQVQVFNPLGGAIAILVPYLASDGIVNVSVTNVLEAPFISIKDFYTKNDVEAEMLKPGPWVVFESDNVMYTLPKHHTTTTRYDVLQALQNWDEFVKGMNFVLGRAITYDKHNLYMIQDNLSRAGVNSLGYPMSNFPGLFPSGPGHSPWFIHGGGPHKGYSTPIHEHGHGIAISKFPGEPEATVNFLYVMGMSKGRGRDIDQAWKECVSPKTQGIDDTALTRMLSDTFGSERINDDIQYTKKGFAHYVEIAKVFGWCALRNFWEQEYLDAEAGNDYGINNQDIDSRIIRMSVAAKADLRPLFEFYGIVPQDVVAVDTALEQLNIQPSLALYNRLNEYFNVIPVNNDALVTKGLEIYPNLYEDGPSYASSYDYRYVGLWYSESLTYNEAEADRIRGVLQGIIDKYYLNGQPLSNSSEVICFSDAGIDPDPVCLNTNGDFSSGNTNWSDVWTEVGVSATSDASSGEMAVTGITGTTADWHVQLETYHNFQEGETYTINFDARADVAGDVIVATREAGGVVAPENYKVQAIGTTMSSYSIEYVHFGNAYTAGQLLFYLGNFGNVNIDNVCISSVQTLNSILVDEAQNKIFFVYPNPTDAELNINIPEAGTIEIVSLSGKVLMEVNIESSGTKTLNIDELSSGVYLCRYKNSNSVKVLKMVKM